MLSKNIVSALNKIYTNQSDQLEHERKFLSAVTHYLHNSITKLNQSLLDTKFTSYDYDDRERFIANQEYNSSKYQRISEMEIICKEPYFARMDFEQDENIEVVYISKSNFPDISEFPIYDWRSPVGQRYYMKNDIAFTHNNYRYNLLLRRSINIDNNNLKSYYDEFVIGSELADSNITDPFLQKLIVEKRKIANATDIISTIQQQQNEIIKFPKDKNFILQGCAGCGKTMIMLHRLSFILYNNPSLNVEKIKIITPNDNFNVYINDLCRQLDLDKIDRLTIDRYLVQLANKYISAGNNLDLKDESLLPQNLVSVLYSHSFYSFVEKQLDLFITTRIQDSINKTNLILARTGNAYRIDIDLVLNNVVREIRSISSKLKIYLTNHNAEIAKEIERIEKRINSEIGKLNEVNNTINKIETLLESNQYNFNQLQHKQNLVANQILDVISQSNVQNIKSIYVASDIGYVVNKFLNANIVINIKIDSQQKNLETLYREIEAVSSNISSIENESTKIKNRIEKNDLLAKQRIFFRKWLARIASIKLQKKYDEYVRNLLSLNSTLDHYNNEVMLINKNITEMKSRKVDESSMNQVISKWNIYGEYDSQINSLRKQNNDLMSEIDKDRSKLVHLSYSIKENQSLIVELNNKLIDKNDQLIIEKTISNITKIDYSDLKILLDQILVNTYKKSNYELKIKQSPLVYKHQIIYLLMLLSKYHGRLLQTDLLVNIDESQDISHIELLTIMRVLNNKASINLYGDINQRTNPMGMNDWTVLQSIEQVFELNMNYRNTLEITDYCNRKLNIHMDSIGISGQSVTETTSSGGFEMIKEDVFRKASDRCAIITDKMNSALIEACISIGCKVNEITNENIAIFTVPEVKGLEFEKVYVYLSSSNTNSRYIGYTRALQHLIIIKDYA